MKPGGVREEYGRLASKYDRRWSRYVQKSVRETLQRTSAAAGERLLDVGCGTGTLLARLVAERPGVEAWGVDLSTGMLQVARRKLPPRIPLLAADVQRLPLATSSFSVVVSSSSLHYWPRPALALREIARVLRPGGRLVLTDWCNDFVTIRAMDLALRVFDSAHQRAYTSEECERLLADAGFLDIKIERYRIDWFWGMMTAVATTRHA